MGVYVEPNSNPTRNSAEKQHKPTPKQRHLPPFGFHVQSSMSYEKISKLSQASRGDKFYPPLGSNLPLYILMSTEINNQTELSYY
jgi:hypothetical protein